MKNGLFTLDFGSVADAVVMAVAAALLTALVGVVSTTGFNVFTAPWTQIGQNMVNTGFIAAVITLGQSFFSTNTGSVLGLTPSYSANDPHN